MVVERDVEGRDEKAVGIAPRGDERVGRDELVRGEGVAGGASKGEFFADVFDDGGSGGRGGGDGGRGDRSDPKTETDFGEVKFRGRLWR